MKVEHEYKYQVGDLVLWDHMCTAGGFSAGQSVGRIIWISFCQFSSSYSVSYMVESLSDSLAVNVPEFCLSTYTECGAV